MLYIRGDAVEGRRIVGDSRGRENHVSGGQRFPENLRRNTSVEDAACRCTSARQLSSEHNRQLEAPMEAQQTQHSLYNGGGRKRREDEGGRGCLKESEKKITITFIHTHA